MNQNHPRLAFLVSLAAIALIGLDFFSLQNFSQQQVNEQNAASQAKKLAYDSQFQGQVLAGSLCSTNMLCANVTLKDSSTGQDITGPGFKVMINSPQTWSCPSWGDFGVGSFPYYVNQYYPEVHYYHTYCNLAAGATFPSSITVTVSKSGYKTKTVTASCDAQTNFWCPDGNGAAVLGPVILEPGTDTYNPSATKKTPPPPPGKVETIKDVSLPNVFKPSGGSTTDLSKIADPAKVDSLTLETTNNTIKFEESVDLSAADTKNKFKSLDSYVRADRAGIISVDSTALPALNKKATITMKNLKYSTTPRILVNGKENPSVVSNVVYKDGTLTFDVTHFSTFIAAPRITINEPKNGLETKEAQISLKGVVTDKSASVSATLNGGNLGYLPVATSSGQFSKTITLKEGLNKIEVNANSLNGAIAAASVSATLIKTALEKNLMPMYAALAILAVIAVVIAIFALKKMRKTPPPTPLTNSAPAINNSASNS